MIETLILNIIANLLVLGVFAGLFLIYWKKKSEQMVNGEQEDPLTEIFADLLESTTEIIKNELNSEDIQILITESVMNGISTLIAKKENQQAINDYVTNIITNSLNEIIPQITGALPITEKEMKNIDKKTEKAIGAMTVNAASEMLPPGVGFVLDKIFPDWKDQAQNNPREFMALLNKARDYGIFQMIPGLDNQLQSTPARRTKSTF